MFSVTSTDSGLAAPKLGDRAPSLYLLSDLGTVAGGAPLLPVAINDIGDIAAAAATPDAAGAMRGYRVVGRNRIPAGIAVGHAPIAAIASNGAMAGAAGSAASGLRAWSSHLGVFGETHWPKAMSIARGVNAKGQVIGNVQVDAGAFSLSRAFLLSTRNSIRMLNPPEGGSAIAASLNDAGGVALNASALGAPLGETRVWCFHDDCFTAVPGLGGNRSWATAITQLGAIVGHSLTKDGATHAFLWRDGETADLGTLPGCTCEALAATDPALVVGRLTDTDGKRRAFRWTADRGMVRLDELVAAPQGWELFEAIGVNRAGVIVGVGSFHERPRGFKLTPIKHL